MSKTKGPTSCPETLLTIYRLTLDNIGDLDVRVLELLQPEINLK